MAARSRDKSCTPCRIPMSVPPGFERLLADLAGRLGGLDSRALDEAIGESLREVGEALHIDRAMVWRRRTGEPVALVTHAWVRPPYAAIDDVALDAMPSIVHAFEGGEPCWSPGVDDIDDPDERDAFRERHERSVAVVPIAGLGKADGDEFALAFTSIARGRQWEPAIFEGLRVLSGVIGQALAHLRGRHALEQALGEVRDLRDRLSAENVELRREIRALRPPSVLIAESVAMRQVVAQIEQVAPTPATVPLLGETGTGKEVVATSIHNLSPRHQRPMVRVSCSAIPVALIESELFGRERGAYTGAISRQAGRFEAADQSTLFLDEVGELPMAVQTKLLRVIQERAFERLGSTHPVRVDLRIIAATNRNLDEAVANKSFREDLFYRLNVFPIVVPPLRDRAEDVPGLVWSFIEEFSKTLGKTIESVAKESMQELQRHSWPGNVRELRNVIERAVIVAKDRQLVVPPLRAPAKAPLASQTLSALETDHIRSVLESTNWRVRGQGGAAERLGLRPTTLESRMARLGITRKRTS